MEINPKVQEWEALMWKFQQALPNTPEGTKWVLMEKIYDLNRSEMKQEVNYKYPSVELI